MLLLQLIIYNLVILINYPNKLTFLILTEEKKILTEEVFLRCYFIEYLLKTYH